MTPETTLPIHDVEELLRSLQCEVDPADLKSISSLVGAGTTSVHAHALGMVLAAETSEHEAQLWARVCTRMIEIQAPVTNTYGHGVTVQFAGMPWGWSPQRLVLIHRLGDAYIDADLLNVHAPVPGEFDGFQWNGMTPLAVAITGHNPASTRFFCDRGASLQVGKVYADRPPYDALVLANDLDSPEVYAVLVEVAMTRQLAKTDGHFATAAKTRRSSL